jgi:hypothetical protein
MTTTNTLFNTMFAALALAGVVMASAPASAGLSDRVDAIASAETTNTGVQDEVTASAEPRAAEAASKERSPRHDSDVTARRHTQAKPAPTRHVERTESRKPRFSWHAVSYAAATPVGLGLPCHRR